MSISLPSDIVLDVARASDPQKYRAAVERLAQLGGAAAVDDAADPARLAAAGAAFEAAQLPVSLAAPETPSTTGTEAAAKAASVAAAKAEALPASVQSKPAAEAKSAEAYRKFEAFLLQTFVESMLPKDAKEVYGSGTAGEIWRSMFAERIADELAKSTKLGIAERVSKQKERIEKGTRPGAIMPPASGKIDAATNG